MASEERWTPLELVRWTTDYFRTHALPSPRLDAELWQRRPQHPAVGAPRNARAERGRASTGARPRELVVPFSDGGAHISILGRTLPQL